MPQELFDAEGNKFEVPTSEELAELQSARETLAELEDKSAGIRSLREANKRKDSVIAEMKAELEKSKNAPAPSPATTDPQPTLTVDQIASHVKQETTKNMVDLEVRRALSDYTQEERDSILDTFGRLTQGRDISVENYHSYLSMAENIIHPDPGMHSRPAAPSGRPPRAQQPQEPKSFADTPEGKDLATRMGMNIGQHKK